MKETINATWNLLRSTVNIVRNADENVRLNEKAFLEYSNNFKKYEGLIKDRFMKRKVSNLDRHKVSSIIIISILEADAIKYDRKLEKGEMFFGNYVIAASVGFKYMQDCLNKALEQKGEKTIDALFMPKALSCDTDYFDIFCRNLYYANEVKEAKWGLNPLDIAEKLFLLEQLTLHREGINPEILRQEN